MPYQHRFTQRFTECVQKLNEDQRRSLLAELKKVLALKDPREKGGRYLNAQWAYPCHACQQRFIFICRIDDEKRLVDVLDWIRP